MAYSDKSVSLIVSSGYSGKSGVGVSLGISGEAVLTGVSGDADGVTVPQAVSDNSITMRSTAAVIFVFIKL